MLVSSRVNYKGTSWTSYKEAMLRERNKKRDKLKLYPPKMRFISEYLAAKKLGNESKMNEISNDCFITYGKFVPQLSLYSRIEGEK